MRIRSTVRWRLTALYGFLFFLCGALLLATSYVLVRQSLAQDEDSGGRRAAEQYGFPIEDVQRFLDIPLPNAPVESTDGDRAETVGDVIDGVQRNTHRNALDDLVVGSGLALIVMVGLSVLVGWVAAGRALRPVKQLTSTAQDLSEANLDQRIHLEGPEDELKELADTLDAMLARLEVSFHSQRRFAADVSHELRTPLSIVRGECELTLSDPDATDAERRLATAVRDAALRAQALIESLLALARSDSTMHEREAVDLAELTGDVVGERVEAASVAGVEVDLDLGTAFVEGDRWLLERLVANLVDNAIRHNASPGWLRVAVDASGASAHLEVSNTGPPLTPADVEEITKPFRRLDRDGDQEGFGLGMTIVQSVVDAHGGEVRLTPRQGGGLHVAVALPAAPRRSRVEVHA